MASGSKSVTKGSDSISTRSSRSGSYIKGSDSMSSTAHDSEGINQGSDAASLTCSRPNSAMKGSDSLFLQECDICSSQGITEEAISYCSVCCEYLCQRCEHAHKGSRTLSQHKLLTGTEMPIDSSRMKPKPPIMFCDSHKTNVGNIYCKRHSDVICSTCQMTHHVTCDTIGVDKQIAQIDLDESLRTTAKDMSELKTRFEGLKKKKTTGTANINDQIKKCLDEMQSVRREINERLDKLEKEMADEIRAMEDNISKEIEGHVTIVDDVLQQIDQHRKGLEDYQKSRELEVRFVGMTKTNLRINEFRAIFVKVLKQAPVATLHFKAREIFTEILKRTPSFGTVVVEREDVNFSRNQMSGLAVSGVNRSGIGLESQIVYGYTFLSLGK